MLQMLVVNQASKAPPLSSAFNQSGFNLGNAIGAWLGGMMLAGGVRLIDLPFGSAVLIALAIGLTLPVCRRLKRNQLSA